MRAPPLPKLGRHERAPFRMHLFTNGARAEAPVFDFLGRRALNSAHGAHYLAENKGTRFAEREREVPIQSAGVICWAGCAVSEFEAGLA